MWTMSTADGLLSVLNFSTDLFERATAVRFLAQLRTMLLSLLEDPHRAIGRLPLLTEGERRIALGTSDRERTEEVCAAPTRSLLATIVAAAAARPDAVAVSDTTLAPVTYADLLARAEAVRAALVAAGVVSGARVAIIADSVAARVAALLGVHAAGGAVLLLDGGDPPAYNRMLATTAGIAATVMAEADAEALAIAGPCIALDALAPASSPLVTSVAEGTPGEIAFLLHDVDASGQPTTAPLAHSTLDAIVADVVARVGVNTATVAVPIHSPAVPAAVYEMLVPLAAGARLSPVPASIDGDTALLARFLPDAGATFVAAPAELFGELDGAGWRGDSRLAAVITEGATPTLLAAIAPRVGHVLALCGHAVTGSWNAAAVPNEPENATHIGYGVGIAGAHLIVLDSMGEVTVPGVPGWLHVRGPAIDAAARVHAADPRFVTVDTVVPNTRAFRTGARARRTADGRVEVLAAEPERVSRDGRVIGVNAIATALRSHPSVTDAAVTVLPNEDGVARPVACIVAARGQEYTETELRRHVRERLPEAAVPQRFVEVDVIARAANGAVRWDDILTAAPWETARVMVFPTTPTEQYVATVWQEMLGVSRVQSTDKFFDLGGHSLLCFRFIDQVARERGVRVSPRVVLLGTLEQVAAELDGAAPGTGPGIAAPVSLASTAPGSMFGRIKRIFRGA